MSKTTLTLYGRILWITSFIALIHGVSVVDAQAQNVGISLDSVRTKQKAIPLKLKQDFMPLGKRITLDGAGDDAAGVKIAKPHVILPKVVKPASEPVMTAQGDAQDREAIRALLQGDDGGVDSALNPKAAVQLASLEPEFQASDAKQEQEQDVRNGITRDKMISLESKKPFKLQESFAETPSATSSAGKMSYATRMPAGTGADGDEEMDEQFFAKIVRPRDVSRFMKIMKKQGFISLNGKRVDLVSRNTLRSTVTRDGVKIVGPRSAQERDALRKKRQESAVLADASDGLWKWPVDLQVNQRISSAFGYRIHPITGKRAFHQGVDIAAAAGTKILAARDGVVSLVTSHPHLGKYVRIEHADGSFSLYGHLSQQFVDEERVVRAGDVIGAMGSTGRSTGSHLDFSIRFNGDAVDPLDYLNVPRAVAQNTDPVYLSSR